jgi:hypothetical protein
MTIFLFMRFGKVPLMREAAAVSCHQEIAGDSAFSLGMIADFRRSIEQAPFLYRHLYWETGMVGQVLYLEAEAHGVRATGIGCFFDDPTQESSGRFARSVATGWLPDSAALRFRPPSGTSRRERR